MNIIEAVTTYYPQAVDTFFATESKTALLVGGSKYLDINFKEKGYVKIQEILFDGLSNYYKANRGSVGNAYTHYTEAGRDGFKTGSLENRWEIYHLRYIRGRSFPVDYIDNEETAGTTIANLLTDFARLKVVPEVDTMRFSEIASNCYDTLGNLVKGDPTTSKDATGIMHYLDQAKEWMTEHEVPDDDMIAFVSPKTMTKIRQTDELNRVLVTKDFRSERGVDFTLPSYNGMPIVEVPSDRFYTNAQALDEGYGPGDDSYLINFMLISRRACIPIVKLEETQVHDPKHVVTFYGWIINFLMYYDLIIPKNKIIGAYTCVSNTKAAKNIANTVNVAAIAGNAEGTTKIIAVFTTPGGIRGDLYYNTTGFELGAEKSGTLVPVDKSDFKFSQANVYFALVAGGKVVAASGQVTMPQKAGD